MGLEAGIRASIVFFGTGGYDEGLHADFFLVAGMRAWILRGRGGVGGRTDERSWRKFPLRETTGHRPLPKNDVFIFPS